MLAQGDPSPPVQLTHPAVAVPPFLVYVQASAASAVPDEDSPVDVRSASYRTALVEVKDDVPKLGVDVATEAASPSELAPVQPQASGTLVTTFDERTMVSRMGTESAVDTARELRARREASIAFFDNGTGQVTADRLWEACRALGEPITHTESKEITGFARGKKKGVFALDRTTWHVAMTTEQGAQYTTKVDGRKSGVEYVPDEVLLAKDNALARHRSEGQEEGEAGAVGGASGLKLKGDDLRAAALEIVTEMKRCRKSPPGTGMWAEAKFIIAVSLFLLVLLGVLLLLGEMVDSSVGRFTPNVIYEALVLFFAELLWEAFLSWLVLRHNVKINYTRKLGHLLRVPKYFFADFVPTYESTAVSMVFSLGVNQILYMMLFSTWTRRKSKVCDFLFLSQNRKEDRPDTLNYQVTEDLLRFAVYFPFKLVISRDFGKKALVFIPIIINTIGDGLAEPVGVKWGKHKYRTRSLYADGKFWSGSFVRSYEGSSVVFLVSLITVAAYYSEFDNVAQFVFCLVLMPPLMTVAEAFSPHTNDGPFLAVVGCGILWIAFGLL